MAPRIRSKQLESRTARAKLPPRGRPYCVTVGPGVRLGYRRTTSGDGTWLLVLADGKGAATQSRIAPADDRQDANGSDILDYWQAVAQAQNLGRGGSRADEGSDDAPLTVEAAVANYKKDLEKRGRDVRNATVITYNLPPWLASKLAGLINPRDIIKFQDCLMDAGLKPASVNRTMRCFCAMLNLAAKQYPEQVKNMAAWRERTNLHDAERSNNIILNPAQVNAIVQESFARYGDRFGTYVWVHAETGARSSQIEALDVEDMCDATTDMPTLLMPRSKKGKIIKTEPIRVRISVTLAQQLLAHLGARRDGHEPLLVDDKDCRVRPACHFSYERTGEKKNRISEIAKDLKLPKARETDKLPTLYALRHSSIAHMLQRGKPITIVAKVHDTSVAMIERTYAKYITDPAVDQMGDAIMPIEPAAERAKVIPMKRK